MRTSSGPIGFQNREEGGAFPGVRLRANVGERVLDPGLLERGPDSSPWEVPFIPCRNLSAPAYLGAEIIFFQDNRIEHAEEGAACATSNEELSAFCEATLLDLCLTSAKGLSTKMRRAQCRMTLAPNHHPIAQSDGWPSLA